MADAKIRLYLEHPLSRGQTLPLAKSQAHYLLSVMRLADGDRILVFNGRDGEFLARLRSTAKRAGEVLVMDQTRPLQRPPNLWLLFAPIKKARTDFIVEKAAELGVAAIQPVSTRYTNSERIRQDRLQAHAIEAAEQCGGTYVPEVHDIVALDRLLESWPRDRSLIFCDESRAGTPVSDPANWPKPPAAILIGPEGGFSANERNRLYDLPFATAVSLGPRILRADTAAVAAISLWQSGVGDW